MTITIINDCRDANAAGRQVTRAASLFDCPVSFIGVANDLEAAGNLIDALDAIEGKNEGIILVNVAPRHGIAKKWANGTPFGYFRHNNTLVVASIDGFTLSLVKKLQIVNAVHVLDISTVVNEMAAAGELSQGHIGYIAASQFRSFDFLPRIAAFLVKRKRLTSTELKIGEIPDAPKAVWWIDNFGNCKTTILPEEMNDAPNGKKETKFGALSYIPQLKAVADATPALIIGSSGIGEKRFLEIIVQGGNAASHFNIHSGDCVL